MESQKENKMNILARYFWNIIIGIDQLINTLFGGDPDETISSRLGKWLVLPHDQLKWKISYTICRILHLFDKNHCIKNIEEDEGANDIFNRK